MSFVLVMYIYAGMMAHGDSVAMLQVPMQSLAACQREGKKGQELVGGSAKDYRFICLKASD